MAYVKEDEGLHKDVWVLDLVRGSSTRLTFGPNGHDFPVWSPDSSEVAYGGRVNEASQIFKRKADGSGPEELVLKLPGESVTPTDWSHDGRFLVFTRSGAAGVTRTALAALPLGKGAAPVRLSGTMDFAETDGQLSPNGHYLAYESNETGRFEIYVRTFSPESGGQPDGKWLISNNGGQTPQWSADGRKLVWHFGDGFSAVSVDTSHGFRAGVPERLYPAAGAIADASLLTSKGQGLLLKPVGKPVEEPINVLVNWMSAIKPN